ncbi:glycosyltransferase [Lysobacter sp. TY2-98]|uniref:glycosyltransferase n=1 Tax=Lysobacter sp. TY2-98 TaxID=2290922 RepID=UPI0013B46350|nr:glycosyltransferase [Lysobacter sp. TY2-98]
MKILVPLHGFVRWNGGLDLIRMIVAALAHAPDTVEIHYALPKPSWKRRWLDRLSRNLGIFASPQKRALLARGSQDALLVTAEKMIGATNCARIGTGAADIARHANGIGADIVFPSFLALPQRSPPWTGYVFDFQHIDMPDLFSPRIRRRRDRAFRRIARATGGLVVNSRAVADQCVALLGVPRERILAMRFTPYALPEWFDCDPTSVRAKYAIGDDFVLVCNHFWKHKDHATALRAFASLIRIDEFREWQLVCTGDPVDFRDPEHFRGLVSLASELGIADRLHVLGLVPKPEQLALLRSCRVLWQPTLYEGGPGGGACYEAMGLGIPTILSDIPVNREITEGPCAYFVPGSASDLVAQTTTLLSTSPHALDREAAIEAGKRRLRLLCDQLLAYLQARVQQPR